MNKELNSKINWFFNKYICCCCFLVKCNEKEIIIEILKNFEIDKEIGDIKDIKNIKDIKDIKDIGDIKKIEDIEDIKKIEDIGNIKISFGDSDNSDTSNNSDNSDNSDKIDEDLNMKTIQLEESTDIIKIIEKCDMINDLLNTSLTKDDDWIILN